MYFGWRDQGPVHSLLLGGDSLQVVQRSEKHSQAQRGPALPGLECHLHLRHSRHFWGKQLFPVLLLLTVGDALARRGRETWAHWTIRRLLWPTDVTTASCTPASAWSSATSSGTSRATTLPQCTASTMWQPPPVPRSQPVQYRGPPLPSPPRRPRQRPTAVLSPLPATLTLSVPPQVARNNLKTTFSNFLSSQCLRLQLNRL